MLLEILEAESSLNSPLTRANKFINLRQHVNRQRNFKELMLFYKGVKDYLFMNKINPDDLVDPEKAILFTMLIRAGFC